MALVSDYAPLDWMRPNPTPSTPIGNDFGLPVNPQLPPGVIPIVPTQAPDLMTGSAHDFNPNTGLSREAYRDAWMSSGISNIDQMKNWLAQNGGSILSGNGTVQTPYGDILDMGTAFRTGNGTPGWTTVNGPIGGGAQGSVMSNAGAPSLMQLLAALIPQNQNGMQMQAQPVQQGAMPYNQYAGQTQSVSNYWGSPTGQSDGTLLGTSFGPSGQVANAALSANNNMQSGMNQQSKAVQRKPGFGPSIMGTPTDQTQKNEQFNSKPVPNNNLPSNF